MYAYDTRPEMGKFVGPIKMFSNCVRVPRARLQRPPRRLHVALATRVGIASILHKKKFKKKNAYIHCAAVRYGVMRVRGCKKVSTTARSILYVRREDETRFSDGINYHNITLSTNNAAKRSAVSVILPDVNFRAAAASRVDFKVGTTTLGETSFARSSYTHEQRWAKSLDD